MVRGPGLARAQALAPVTARAQGSAQALVQGTARVKPPETGRALARGKAPGKVPVMATCLRAAWGPVWRANRSRRRRRRQAQEWRRRRAPTARLNA